MPLKIITNKVIFFFYKFSSVQTQLNMNLRFLQIYIFENAWENREITVDMYPLLEKKMAYP